MTIKYLKQFFFMLLFIFFAENVLCSYSPTRSFRNVSSFQPVGSGARAIGLSAFIGVVDDGTATSWNPAGLSNLKKKEFTLVAELNHYIEKSNFTKNPEATNIDRSWGNNLNYSCFAYPFKSFETNMAIAISYQRLYDLNREWNFFFHDKGTNEDYIKKISYDQSGDLSAIGLSYSIDLSYKLAIGFTFNIWENTISNNSWEIITHEITSGFSEDIFLSGRIDEIESYEFSGYNLNLGFLWHVANYLTIGGVIKTPFKADITYKSEEFESSSQVISDDLLPVIIEETRIIPEIDEHMHMPISYGLGCLYKLTYDNSFYLAADIYRTHWDKFVYTNFLGDEKSPISGKQIEHSDIDPTIQVRLGIEYFHLLDTNVIRFRGGTFYDPVPAEGSPDDYFGFSFGTGFVKKNSNAQSTFYDDLYSLDIAYQYRFGKDSGKSLMKSRGFSQKKEEHKIYLSLIFYGF